MYAWMSLLALAALHAGCQSPARLPPAEDPGHAVAPAGPEPREEALLAGPAAAVEAAEASTRDAPAERESPAAPSAPSWAPGEQVVPHAQTRVIVLAYHTINRGSLARAVDPAEIERQVAWMRGHHVEIVPLSKLVDFLRYRIELPEKVAVITIDDGELNFYQNGYPTMLKHRVPFALGLPTLQMEKFGGQGTMTWGMIREMLLSGYCEIASHSHTHSDLTRLTPRALERELVLSRELIEKHTGVTPTSFFYPLGAYNQNVLAKTEEHGYEAGFVAVGERLDEATGRYRIPRFDVRGDTTLGVLRRFFTQAGLRVTPEPRAQGAKG